MNEEELCEVKNSTAEAQILLECVISSLKNSARTRKMSCEMHICYDIREHLQKISDYLELEPSL